MSRLPMSSVTRLVGATGECNFCKRDAATTSEQPKGSKNGDLIDGRERERGSGSKDDVLDV